MIDHRKPYCTIVVPRVPNRFRTEWHPSNNDPETASWPSLTRGAYATEEEAIQWGKDHLGGTPYSIAWHAGFRAELLAELAEADAACRAVTEACQGTAGPDGKTTTVIDARIALAQAFIALLDASMELAATLSVDLTPTSRSPPRIRSCAYTSTRSRPISVRHSAIGWIERYATETASPERDAK